MRESGRQAIGQQQKSKLKLTPPAQLQKTGGHHFNRKNYNIISLNFNPKQGKNTQTINQVEYRIYEDLIKKKTHHIIKTADEAPLKKEVICCLRCSLQLQLLPVQLEDAGGCR
jgi:hypothetical protein